MTEIEVLEKIAVSLKHISGTLTLLLCVGGGIIGVLISHARR